ncbi:MAG TPA: WD40 repeat domain-containing protein [Candidatus Binatia bacterium]|nr:WD40 repeat domain-containing protein [Candidatus Binatia bacterium]
MKARLTVIFGAVMAVCLREVPSVQAQGAPDVVWEAVTPNTLANSIQGVGWSPSLSGAVAFGSTDRWLRTRRADNGALVYSVLQPHRSGSANQTIYSADGGFIAVHNSSGGLGYRVHRAADGVFLGMLTVTIGVDGLVRFSPDTQLLAAVGGDGTLSRWRFKNFTVSVTVGSGYDRTNTTFNFSADGLLQSAASQGTITIRQRSNGQAVRVLKGGLAQGSTPVAFTPDSTRIAAWSNNPNEVVLWRISDGVRLRAFGGSATNEGVGAIRFTPDGAHLVTTGYLPFVDANGLWQQKGVIRFWRVSDGSLRQAYDARTGIGVTSPVAWSPDGTRFAYGTYEGTAVAARTPVAVQTTLVLKAVEVLPDGNVLLRQRGTPGAEYHVEVTTNMVVSRELGVATANSNGYYEFLDTNGHGSSLKFYRFWKTP